MKYLDVVCIERGVGGAQRERFKLRHGDEQPGERIAMVIRQLCHAACVVVLNRQRFDPVTDQSRGMNIAGASGSGSFRGGT